MPAPTKEWLQKYAAVKAQLESRTDLDAYFTEKQIGQTAVDTLNIGTVQITTGHIFACDPLVELGNALPYIQTVPAGNYPVTICVVPSEKYGDRYACVKVGVSSNKPVRYELGMTGRENLDDELEDGSFFGFGVDAGMGCIADMKTQEEFSRYWKKRESEEAGINPYDDLFDDLLRKSYQDAPKYQIEYGSWLNWTVPGTSCSLPIFSSGWGDGVYPCYFGYDAEGEVCGVYIHFIDIEQEYGSM